MPCTERKKEGRRYTRRLDSVNRNRRREMGWTVLGLGSWTQIELEMGGRCWIQTDTRKEKVLM